MLHCLHMSKKKTKNVALVRYFFLPNMIKHHIQPKVVFDQMSCTELLDLKGNHSNNCTVTAPTFEQDFDP